MSKHFRNTQARLLVGLTGLAMVVGCSSRDDARGGGGGAGGAVTSTGGAGGAITSTGGAGGAGTSTGGAGGASPSTGGAGGAGTSTGGAGGATGSGGSVACSPITGTGGGGGGTALNPVAWRTPTVSLTADDFWIVANGARFEGKDPAIDVHSDPGDPTYTSLELRWGENGREMRFFIYLYAPDPTGWFSNEMRTYNNQAVSDWLTYRGTFFLSPIGSPFHGDLDLTNDPSDATRGELHLHGVTLSTTLTGVCTNAPCLGSGAAR